MKFIPLSEEELQTASLVTDGVYTYQVVKSEDKVSQAGNEYISLVLKVWDNEGKDHLIFTNLALIKLLKHFCDVNDMKDLYEFGEIPADKCINKSGGCVMVGLEGEKPDGKGGMYKPKNIIKDYIVSPHGSTLKPLPEKDSFINDDLPF